MTQLAGVAACSSAECAKGASQTAMFKDAMGQAHIAGSSQSAEQAGSGREQHHYGAMARNAGHKDGHKSGAPDGFEMSKQGMHAGGHPGGAPASAHSQVSSDARSVINAHRPACDNASSEAGSPSGSEGSHASGGAAEGWSKVRSPLRGVDNGPGMIPADKPKGPMTMTPC